MHKKTIATLLKIGKINKTKAIAELAEIIAEINDKSDSIKTAQATLRQEIAHESATQANDAHFYHRGVWDCALRTRIAMEESHLPSYVERMELAQVNLRIATKRLSHYQNLK